MPRRMKLISLSYTISLHVNKIRELDKLCRSTLRRNLMISHQHELWDVLGQVVTPVSNFGFLKTNKDAIVLPRHSIWHPPSFTSVPQENVPYQGRVQESKDRPSDGKQTNQPRSPGRWQKKHPNCCGNPTDNNKVNRSKYGLFVFVFFHQTQKPRLA